MLGPSKGEAAETFARDASGSRPAQDAHARGGAAKGPCYTAAAVVTGTMVKERMPGFPFTRGVGPDPPCPTRVNSRLVYRGNLTGCSRGVNGLRTNAE